MKNNRGREPHIVAAEGKDPLVVESILKIPKSLQSDTNVVEVWLLRNFNNKIFTIKVMRDKSLIVYENLFVKKLYRCRP